MSNAKMQFLEEEKQQFCNASAVLLSLYVYVLQLYFKVHLLNCSYFL